MEPIIEERAYDDEEEEEEEAGSFSPVLIHGDEDEEAIDPEEDKAELVHICFLFFMFCACYIICMVCFMARLGSRTQTNYRYLLII